jgi:hypothetical protein
MFDRTGLTITNSNSISDHSSFNFPRSLASRLPRRANEALEVIGELALGREAGAGRALRQGHFRRRALRPEGTGPENGPENGTLYFLIADCPDLLKIIPMPRTASASQIAFLRQESHARHMMESQRTFFGAKLRALVRRALSCASARA